MEAWGSTCGVAAYAAAVVVRTLNLATRAGQWVALDVNDQVARAERTLSGLLAAIDAEGLEGLTACRAPRPDAPIDCGTVFSFEFSGAD